MSTIAARNRGVRRRENMSTSSNRAHLLRLVKGGASLQEIEAYVKEHPNSVTEKNAETGCPVLHDVLSIGFGEITSPQIISFLLRANPESICMKDETTGRFPLHIATSDEQPLEIVQLLTEMFRGALNIRDEGYFLPFHYAIENRHFEIASYLVESHVGPIDVVTVVTNEEPLLGSAVLRGAPPAFIRLFISRSAGCCEIANHEGYLPLHHAAAVSSDIEVVRIILDAFPKAVEKTTSNLDLPIHIAVKYGADADLIQEFFDRYPEGFAQANSDGDLPIHLPVRHSICSEETLDTLLRNSPGDSLLKVDERGNTLLHDACASGRGRVIRWLLQHAPFLAHRTNNERCFPLHEAAKWVDNWFPVAILMSLVEANPEALCLPNVNGDFPLHVVLHQDRGSDKFVQAVLERYPECAGRVNSMGQTPLHVACSYDKDVLPKTLDVLVRSHPQALSQFDLNGMLPLHCVVSRKHNFQGICVDARIHSARANERKCFSAAQKLIEHYSEPLPLTKCGTPALFLACENDRGLDLILLLVHHSKELFPGTLTAFQEQNTERANKRSRRSET